MSYVCTVKEGNLLSEKNATFIVNASNTSLQLGSGVSMAFARHCKGLQKEMNQKLQELKEISQGSVILTKSCSNTFKYALHAAVMNYNDSFRRNYKPTLQTIKTILQNIEEIILSTDYDPEENCKLVLPLLGCGTGGLEEEEVIKIYKEFFCREVKINCRVIIYGYSDQDYQLIKEFFN